MGRLKLFGMALLGSVALTFTTAQNADAADLLTEMVNAPATWTGAYAGGHGGYGISDAEWTNLVGGGNTLGPVGSGEDLEPDGGFFGAQVGYMHQMGSFVLGAEVSGSISDIIDTEVASAPAVGTYQVGIDGLLLAQARLGWAVDNWLLFVQGGYAGAEGHASAVSGAFISRREDRWHNGWTVGGGVKYMIWDGVSVGAEYNYVDLGSRTYNVDIIAPGDRARVDHELHLVRGTVSIHLPWLAY